MSLAMTGDLERALRTATSDTEVVAVGGERSGPVTVVEAELALRDEFEALRGQYRPETVTALLDLLDGAADNVAQVERERWSFALRRMARRATSFSPETRAGVHMAASLIERNQEPS